MVMPKVRPIRSQWLRKTPLNEEAGRSGLFSPVRMGSVFG
jgi:hypothetical protein